jgi:hypothetical protein
MDPAGGGDDSGGDRSSKNGGAIGRHGGYGPVRGVCGCNVELALKEGRVAFRVVV